MAGMTTRSQAKAAGPAKSGVEKKSSNAAQGAQKKRSSNLGEKLANVKTDEEKAKIEAQADVKRPERPERMDEDSTSNSDNTQHYQQEAEQQQQDQQQEQQQEQQHQNHQQEHNQQQEDAQEAPARQEEGTGVEGFGVNNEADRNDEDEVGRVKHPLQGKHVSSPGDSGELEIYFKWRYGKIYGAYRHGPPNAACYRVEKLASHINNLDAETKQKVDCGDDLSAKETQADRLKSGSIYQILGVASGDGFHDRIESLSPSKWKTNKNGVPIGPPLIAKVRLYHKDGPVTWEKRSTLRDCLFRGGPTWINAPGLHYGQTTLVKDGERIRAADWFIIDTAVTMEKMHDEYMRGERKAQNPNLLKQEWS